MNQPADWLQEKWNETIATILRRAAHEVGFREKCLGDPRTAFWEISGFDLPAASKVRFIEPRDETVIVLPPLQVAGAGAFDAAREKPPVASIVEAPWTVSSSPTFPHLTSKY